jgi:hypothetical protein
VGEGDLDEDAPPFRAAGTQTAKPKMADASALVVDGEIRAERLVDMDLGVMMPKDLPALTTMQLLEMERRLSDLVQRMQNEHDRAMEEQRQVETAEQIAAQREMKAKKDKQHGGFGGGRVISTLEWTQQMRGRVEQRLKQRHVMVVQQMQAAMRAPGADGAGGAGGDHHNDENEERAGTDKMGESFLGSSMLTTNSATSGGGGSGTGRGSPNRRKRGLGAPSLAWQQYALDTSLQSPHRTRQVPLPAPPTDGRPYRSITKDPTHPLSPLMAQMQQRNALYGAPPGGGGKASGGGGDLSSSVAGPRGMRSASIDDVPADFAGFGRN